MSFSSFAGPILSWYRGRTQSGGAGDNNPDAPAPDMSAYGYAVMDVRDPFAFQPGQGGTRRFFGFLGAGDVVLIDQVPSTISTTNVAAAAAPAAGVAMTLVAASGSGITVGVSVVNALTGVAVTGLRAIDGAMGSVALGDSGSMNLWDPAKALSRALSLTSTANLSGMTFTARGYDLYGYPVTCTRAGPNNNTVNFTKALKYVASVTPSGTNAGTVSVGISDIFGLPLRADAFAYVPIYWNDTPITASTGFTAAVTTDPATALTGDVRGTYAVQSASDNTKRLQVFWRPKAANISQSGWFGVPQFPTS